MKNIISKALPTALSIIVLIIITTILKKVGYVPQQNYSSICVIETGICGLILLATLSKSRKSENSKLPISTFRFVLFMAMALMFVIGLKVFKNLFGIVL